MVLTEFLRWNEFCVVIGDVGSKVVGGGLKVQNGGRREMGVCVNMVSNGLRWLLKNGLDMI